MEVKFLVKIIRTSEKFSFAKYLVLLGFLWLVFRTTFCDLVGFEKFCATFEMFCSKRSKAAWE